MTMQRARPKRLILIRHGETAWNREERIQGQLDAPLNALGVRQAALTAQALMAGGWFEGVEEIVSSDLSRALDTASAIAEISGLPLRQERSLRERHFGELQGITYAEWRQADAEGLARFRAGDPDYGPPGGETARDFLRRCVEAVTHLVMSASGSHVLAVTHGGVISSLYRHSRLLGFASERTWSVPNASLSVWHLRWPDSGVEFVCERIGDAAHLEGSETAALEAIEK